MYYTTGDYANAVSNEAKAVGMASVMLSNQEVYTVCLFGDAAPEEVDGTTYAPTTGGAIYQGVNVQKDKLIFELVAPETLTVGEPVELGINAATTLTGNAVGRAAGVAIDPTGLSRQRCRSSKTARLSVKLRVASFGPWADLCPGLRRCRLLWPTRS